MKKIMIVLAASLTFVMCLTSCFSEQDNPKKVELGERYDSDKVVKFSPGSTYIDNYQDELHKVYERYLKDASETQFVVHEKTAIAIAEAVIKEIYPDEDYQVLYLPTYPKALYYETENCWEVWLYIRSSRDRPVAVYVDVNTGAVKAIIPADEFSVHNPANSESDMGTVLLTRPGHKWTVLSC